MIFNGMASCLISAHSGSSPCCPGTSVYALPVMTRVSMRSKIKVYGDHDGHNDHYWHDGYVKHSDHSAKGQHEGHGELSFVSNEHGDQDEHHAELSMSMNLVLGFPPSRP